MYRKKIYFKLTSLSLQLHFKLYKKLCIDKKKTLEVQGKALGNKQWAMMYKEYK